MSGTYDLGNLVRVSGSFGDLQGNPADPSTVICRVKDPAGTVTPYAYDPGDIVKDGTGRYHLDLTPAISGLWFYRWEGTGSVIAASDSTFTISPSPVVCG